MNEQSLDFFTDTQNRDWRQIRGWLLTAAAQALHKYALQAASDGSFVEIGSYAGKSTVCIGSALKSRPGSLGLTAIDIRFQPDFTRNLEDFGLLGNTRMIKGSSMDAAEDWNTPISFLYIDGHHGKAYALADLLVWDMFLLPGGILALDDTAGFMVGPNLQIQAATRTGAYELLEEAGGISFLRKNHSILPLQDHPLTPGSFLGNLHVISAWAGAMDPSFRLPRLPLQKMPLSEILDRILHTPPVELAPFIWSKVRSRLRRISAANAGGGTSPTDGLPPDLRKPHADLQWLKRQPGLDASTRNTLDYLEACLAMRGTNWQTAIQLLRPLGDTSPEQQLVHYAIPLAEMAWLRMGQVHDLMGEREKASDCYRKIAGTATIPELRESAAGYLSKPFQPVHETGNLLLREYNLALYQYKRSVS